MNRIAELRKRDGLSQKELGKEIGAAQNTVSQWEKGLRQPDPYTLAKLSSLFGVSIDYILGVGEGTSLPDAGQRPPGFDDFTFAMFHETKELTEENKQKLLEMARFFKEQQEKTKQEPL